MTDVEPLGDRIVVRRIESPRQVGRIILPDSTREQSDRGEVLAVGPGKDEPIAGIEPGDVVLFAPFAGSLVSVDGEEFLILREADVLGRLRGQAALAVAAADAATA